MSQVSLTWLADALRKEGCRVNEYEGWKSRGRPSGDFNPYGVLVHHTGTPTSYANPCPTLSMCVHGRPDLSGPLCQVVIGYDGLCHVIAAGRANHAGECDGDGPFPYGDGNAMMVGFEVDYSGSQPVSPEQADAAIRASAAVLRRFKRSEAYCRGHKETSTSGKWDPGRAGSSDPRYLMNEVRKYVKQRLAGTLAPAETWAPMRLLVAAAHEGGPMPPEYLLRDTADGSPGKGNYYGVFPSGLVRMLPNAERNHLPNSIPVVEITDKDSGNRILDYDKTLRGYLTERA